MQGGQIKKGKLLPILLQNAFDYICKSYLYLQACSSSISILIR